MISHARTFARSFALVALLSLPAARIEAQKVSPALLGGYDATLYKGRALPTEDRFSVRNGFQHRAKLQQMYLVLRANGTFTAGAQYAVDYRRASDKHPLPPLVDETVKGTYSIKGGTINFVPQKTSRNNVIRPTSGTIGSGGMKVTYLLSLATGTEVLPVEFRRNPNLLY
ncbi:MAG: hypothetical protein JWO05_1896 [Gemmatimonadetes bacterium]|nr:hypothetical protein [Gemmatimonadota bacterium]